MNEQEHIHYGPWMVDRHDQSITPVSKLSKLNKRYASMSDDDLAEMLHALPWLRTYRVKDFVVTEEAFSEWKIDEYHIYRNPASGVIIARMESSIEKAVLIIYPGIKPIKRFIKYLGIFEAYNEFISKEYEYACPKD